ncbi:hypothetical protein RA266_27855, partial [Pseudomonas syringae pv. tagetis]|uniref:hypothetical protein n=1 Tax=Pseudomonas syringae group genomosp. 7 TaxID=251699 RepID=UPI00376F4DC3
VLDWGWMWPDGLCCLGLLFLGFGVGFFLFGCWWLCGFGFVVGFWGLVGLCWLWLWWFGLWWCLGGCLGGFFGCCSLCFCGVLFWWWWWCGCLLCGCWGWCVGLLGGGGFGGLLVWWLC